VRTTIKSSSKNINAIWNLYRKIEFLESDAENKTMWKKVGLLINQKSNLSVNLDDF
jgi:hypothetical protein